MALQRLVRQIDPELPVNDLRSMDTRIADSLVAQRSPALVASVFSLIAILLIAVGTYGVLSYAVAQRRREIGVRMALGARPGQIRSQFLALGLRLLAAGVILGAIGCVADRPGHADDTLSDAASSRRRPCRRHCHHRRSIPSRLCAAIPSRRPSLPDGGPKRFVANHPRRASGMTKQEQRPRDSVKTSEPLAKPDKFSAYPISLRHSMRLWLQLMGARLLAFMKSEMKFMYLACSMRSGPSLVLFSSIACRTKSP